MGKVWPSLSEQCAEAIEGMTMRLLNEDSDIKVDRLTLYLTREEALQLKSDLDQLLVTPHKNHAHISSKDRIKELTVCVYDETNLEGFSARSKKLIRDDV